MKHFLEARLDGWAELQAVDDMVDDRLNGGVNIDN